MNKTLFLISLLLIISNGQAQEKLSLSIEQAKEQALNYNRTIKNSGLAIDKSQETLWAAIAAGR